MRKNKVPYQSGEKLSVHFSAGSRHVVLILLILAICIALMRAHTYTEPIERDIGSHAVIAHELLEGRKLYSDLWDSKPPAIFITYALADAIVGQGPLSVYIVGMAAALITLLGVYYAASAYGGRIAGLWAAAFWTFICSDLWLWANQPNIEVGINASIVWAFALVLRSSTKRISPIRWILIGLLFAVATLYKQTAILFPAIICSIYFLLSLRDKKQTVIALSQICITLMTGVFTWLAVFGYFAITDRVSIFY
jgi:4-amino-4-deoxy-L-arabinose transferase-like glycosyltransferase